MPNELHNAAQDPIKGFKQVKKLIEEDHVDIDAPHTELNTRAVEFAAESGSLFTLKYLIDQGADLNAEKREKNLLHWALRNTPEVISYVTSPKYNILGKFADGTTDLHAAAATGNRAAIEAILSQNPKRVREHTVRGENALYWAAAGEQPETFVYLTEHPAYKLCSGEEIDEDNRIVAECFNSSGNHYYDTGNRDESVQAYRNAVYYRGKVKEKNDDDFCSLALYYSNLGEACLRAKNRESSAEAVEFFNSALHQLSQVKDKNTEAYKQLLADCEKGMKKAREPKAKEVRPGKIERVISELKSEFGGQSYFSFFSQPGHGGGQTTRAAQEPTERLKLLHEAESWGFQVKEISRDGNCFFHAVADQLRFHRVPELSKMSHIDLRTRTDEHIAKYIDAYRDFIDPGHKDDAYLNKLNKKGTWPDGLAIFALSRELNVNLVILRSDGKTLPQIIKRPDANAPTLYLGWEFGNHYQSLYPKPGMEPNSVIKDLLADTEADDFRLSPNMVPRSY